MNVAKHIANDAKGKVTFVQNAVKNEGGVFKALGNGMTHAWKTQPLLTGIAGVSAAYFAANAYAGHHARKVMERQANQQQGMGL